jgi:CTP synthase (UTP-ammonia lyase)
MPSRIAIIGEYTRGFPPHASTDAAIEHSRSRLGVDLAADWISTADIDSALFERCTGIWVAPGSPYKNMDKTLWAIRYARENNVPCLGTCGGFQHLVIEYARNVLGFRDAQHAEYDPYSSRLFISQLACSLAGREMALKFATGSRVAAIYGSLAAKEEYYCNFGFNPEYVAILKRGPLTISGADLEGEVRVIEHPSHRFFIGTLFVPQSRSTAAAPHPLVSAFLQAATACARRSHTGKTGQLSRRTRP